MTTNTAGTAWFHDLGVVIPTFNAARFLSETLSSVGVFGAKGATIIVVDGGSTDDTRAICDRYGVRVLHEKQAGLYAAINRGFGSLDARWMTWINADDILFPSGVMAYGGQLEAGDIHYGTVDYIDADGRFLHAWQSASPPRLRGLFRSGCSPLLQQGTIFRRDVFRHLGGFDASMKYVADADFWWRALEAGFRFQRLARPTVAGFRLHSRQLSQVHAKEMKREHQAMVVSRLGKARLCGCSKAAAAYRLCNTARYIVRWLRRRDLSGGFGLPRSYDVP